MTQTPSEIKPEPKEPIPASIPAASTPSSSLRNRMALAGNNLRGRVGSAINNVNSSGIIRENVLVAFIFLWVILSIAMDVSNRHEQGGGNYTVGIHVMFAYCSMPFLMQVYPFLINWKWQAIVAIMVLVLDWVSLREDKTRFSERQSYFLTSAADPTITGRQNAFFTGIGAHLADVLGLVMILLPVAGSSWKWYLLIVIPALIYSVAGCYYILNLTKDGGESDVRKLTNSIQEIEALEEDGAADETVEAAKVKAYDDILSSKRTVQFPNIWPDYERQMINLVITYIGAMASWQAIFASYGTWDGDGRLTKVERAYFGFSKEIPESCKGQDDISKNPECKPWWDSPDSYTISNFVFVNCFTHMYYAFIGPLLPFIRGEESEDSRDPVCAIEKEQRKYKWVTILGLWLIIQTVVNMYVVTGLPSIVNSLLVFFFVMIVYIITSSWSSGYSCWLDRFLVSSFTIMRFMLPFFFLIINVILTILPNYNNWINTGYQAAAPSGELFLEGVPVLSDSGKKETLSDDNEKALNDHKAGVRKRTKAKFA